MGRSREEKVGEGETGQAEGRERAEVPGRKEQGKLKEMKAIQDTWSVKI